MNAENQSSANGQPPALPQVSTGRASVVLPAIIIIIAAVLALAIAWQWYDTRNQIASLQLELAKRLVEAEAVVKESRNRSAEAIETARRAETETNLLEAKLAESKTQQLALEALYQELTRNRDEVALEEVEQLLLIANQQLALASNVKAALIALQEADARLRHIDRPQLDPLRKIIAEDVELLKAVPYVDMSGISKRVNKLAATVDALPLAMESRMQKAAPSPRATADEGDSAWLKLVREAWEGMKRLVRIHRVDEPDAALLSPSQAYFLRENLKLRLLTARQALLARDIASFKHDIQLAANWVNRYYDTRSASVRKMLETLQQLGDSEVGVSVPRVSASLDAIRNYRFARDRGAR
jgi:uroporphyrin-III C-methyltransferase